MSTHHSIADIAHLIKTNSSRWVHGRWPEHHLFARQTGYSAFTVSESGAAAVRAYTSNQQEHHKVRSFQEEFFGVFEEERNCGGMNDISGVDGSFAPLGLYASNRLCTHGLRRGLHSFRRFAAGRNGV